MKRFLAGFTACLFVLSLSACSVGKDKEKSTQQQTENVSESSTAEGAVTTTAIPEQRVEHVAESVEKGLISDFGQFSDADKKKIKEKIEEDGYTFEYNSDGSATLGNEEVTVVVGRGWEDNEYTKGIPEYTDGDITMGSNGSDSDGDFCIFLVRNSSAKEAIEYVGKLEEAGFKDDNKEMSAEAAVVSFEGKNSEGRQVSVGYSSYGFTIKAYK